MKTTLLLAGFLAAATAADTLQPRDLLGGKVNLLVPSSLQPMSDAARLEKYPGKNAPAYVLTNADTTVNVAFDHKQIPFEPAQIVGLEEPMRQRMSSTAKLNSIGMKKINGADILVIDFDMALPDGGQVHNHMAMTSFEGRMLVISYNCLLNLDSKCAALGPGIIESIKLKPAAAAK
jgi:hypothetical protein